MMIICLYFVLLFFFIPLYEVSPEGRGKIFRPDIIRQQKSDDPTTQANIQTI